MKMHISKAGSTRWYSCCRGSALVPRDCWELSPPENSDNDYQTIALAAMHYDLHAWLLRSISVRVRKSIVEWIRLNIFVFSKSVRYIDFSWRVVFSNRWALSKTIVHFWSHHTIVSESCQTNLSAAYYFESVSGKMFGPVGDADVLRQVRPTGISSHGVRLRHGRSSEQHN